MRNYFPLLADSNVQAFLALIRYTEGADYHTLFGGEKFDSLADHPRRIVTRTLAGKPLASSAAGAYQFLTKTWDECVKALGLEDFGVRSQDIAALYLIDRRGALDYVIAGEWERAIWGVNKEWASLPGSPYGQPTKSMEKCIGFLETKTAPAVAAPPPFQQATEPVKGTVMAPFIAAAIPALLQAAPALIRIFGNGAQAEKNAKAAETVAEIAKSVTNSDTVEGAVNAIQADPVMAQTFSSAVQEQWYMLTGEAGGGGIEGARKADLARTPIDKPWLSPALWVAMAILPLVYIVVGAVMFLPDWTMEIKAMVVSSIISLVLGSITGFFLGTSFGSQKKTEMLANR
jgi:muramidase (phage lysozyme)